MMALAHEFVVCDNRAGAADYAADLIVGALDAALSESATASLMVSGGSTPGGVFDRLTRVHIDWHRVIVGLVDERWVDPEHEASNERLVRQRLLTGHSAAAGYVPMKTLASEPIAAVSERNFAYRPHCDPIDVILLGMGNDGHTASWFPGAHGLGAALEPQDGEVVTVVDARGCPVAGDHTHRMTLTGTAVGKAKTAVLLIFGEDKKAVFEAALNSAPSDMPVRYAVNKLGPRLTVVWAP